MAGDPAELAYGHALAMLGDPDAATEVADHGAAPRRPVPSPRAGPRPRTKRSAGPRTTSPSTSTTLQTVVLDLPALAATLASTRPPEERAALDIRARTGGDLVALGEASACGPTDAADKCTEIAESWERDARPGAAGLQRRRRVRRTRRPSSTTPRLRRWPSCSTSRRLVHTHCLDCTVCIDRVRAMASVRNFFSDAVVPRCRKRCATPALVSRTKRPSAEPSPLFADQGPCPEAPVSAAKRRGGRGAGRGARRLRRIGRRSDNQLDDSLTKVAAARWARGSRANPTTDVRLRNNSSKAVRYTLSSAARWLQLSPAAGRLGAGEAVAVAATLSDDAPEGDIRATVTCTRRVARRRHRNFRGRSNGRRIWPRCRRLLGGCDTSSKTATSPVWCCTGATPSEHELDIGKDADGYAAELRPDNGPITYWVTAADTRGNAARTADAVIEPGAC